jgi:hypothetical protein
MQNYLKREFTICKNGSKPRAETATAVIYDQSQL